MSPLSIIFLSPVEKSPRSSQKYAQNKHSLYIKTNMSVDFDVKGQERTDFFTGGSIGIDYRTIFCVEVTV